ncbi:MAG: YceD family protein [Eubacteriales bacterium]
MKIDICELMNRRLDRVDFAYRFDPSHTDAECVLLPEDISIPEDGISVCGSITDTLGCMMFRAVVTVHYVTACARCLDEVREVLEFEMERMVLTEKTDVGDFVDEDGEWNGELNDVLYVNEAKIIPDADILEEISLELPPFVLCREDCPGLCPKCGRRLADGDCGCQTGEKKEVDPRLAILQKLLDNPE